jgi:phosphoglycolate phosphatase-like HAD superfamily hydrolase
LIRAILWDVDGTLAETERDGHLVAFNQAFEALQVPWRWSEERARSATENCSPSRADARSKRIDLKQISRWYAHCVSAVNARRAPGA